MLDEMKIKQLGLKLIEKILLEQNYNNKDEVMLNVIKKYKLVDEDDTKSKFMKSALKFAVDNLYSLSFEEMQELIKIFNKNKKE